MPGMIVKTRVANFEHWKSAFESMNEMRLAHGWLGHTIYRDAQDPNVVTVVSRVADLEKAKQFGASAEMRAAMVNAGIQGPPEIAFVEHTDEYRYQQSL